MQVWEKRGRNNAREETFSHDKTRIRRRRGAHSFIIEIQLAKRYMQSRRAQERDAHRFSMTREFRETISFIPIACGHKVHREIWRRRKRTSILSACKSRFDVNFLQLNRLFRFNSPLPYPRYINLWKRAKALVTKTCSASRGIRALRDTKYFPTPRATAERLRNYSHRPGV